MRGQKNLYPKFQQLASDAPKEPGLYLILCGQTMLYIGMSVNVFKRLLNHEKRDACTKHGLTEIRTMVVHDLKQRRATEKWLISKHKPMLNG